MSIEKLTNALFKQLEEVQITDKTGEQLSELIEKTKSIVTVSGKIIESYSLVVTAMVKQGQTLETVDLPKMLGLQDDKNNTAI